MKAETDIVKFFSDLLLFKFYKLEEFEINGFENIFHTCHIRVIIFTPGSNFFVGKTLEKNHVLKFSITQHKRQISVKKT
jgi:hypothetical protein